MGLYRLYEEHLCPPISSYLNKGEALAPPRRAVAGAARGVVLELGFGTAPNLPHYDADRVERLYALEPAPGMRRHAAREIERVRPAFPVEFLDLPGEQIPLPDASVDSVVSTFTFCTIDDLDAALRGVARVLRPGGTLHFLEHGLAPDGDARMQREQRRMEPLHHFLFPGCRLTRRIFDQVEAGGFALDERERFSFEFTGLWRWMAAAGFFYQGVARPRAET